MTSIDERVRRALSDDRRHLDADVAALNSAVVRRASGLRRKRAAAGVVATLAGVTVVAGVASAALDLPSREAAPSTVETSPTPGTSPPGTSAPVAPATPSQAVVPFSGTTPTSFLGAVEDLELAGSTAYVLAGDAPARLVAVDVATQHARWTARTAVLAAPSSGSGIVRVDPDSRLVWVYRLDEQAACSLQAFDAATGALTRTVDVTCGVTDLAVEHGRVWGAFGGDLMELRPGATRWDVLPGLTSAYSLAVDRSRGRLLVDLEGVGLDAVDVVSRAVVATVRHSLGKASIAWTTGDRLWVAGYVGGDQPRMLRLDPATLTVVGSSPLARATGPGAQVWPGDEVVWIRNGGDEGLECLDAGTGTVLGRWSAVQGPVVSSSARGGVALAAHEGTLVGLDLPGTCPG